MMALYYNPMTETQNSLKKERTQDGPETEVPLCTLSVICQLPLHALE
jgi:hypothetical protein